MRIGTYILAMLMYCIGGGIHIGVSIMYFKAGRYIYGGISAMYAISMVILMAEFAFRFGGAA